MKKAIHFFLLVGFLAFISACTPSPEKLIVGEWTIEKVEVTNIDELIKTQMDAAEAQFDKQLAEFDKQIEAVEDAASKEALIDSKKKVEDLKANLASQGEAMKQQFTQQMGKMSENSSMTFNKDKTYTGTMGGEELKGTWELSEDGKTLTTTEEGEEEGTQATVLEMSADKVVIAMDDEQEQGIVVKMQLTLTKGK